MKSKLFKTFFSLFAFSMLVASMPAAGNAALNLWGDQKTNVQNELGYENAEDPRIIVAKIINLILTFLGVIAVILVIYAGILWMTAGGNDDQVGKAKNLMKNAVIGLVIIFAAWALASFVLNSLSNVVN